MSRAAAEAWDSGSAYDQFVGRWSRKVATEFIHWLALPPRLVWADVGCGTGALASTILVGCEPSSVHGIDSSARFISEARRRISDRRASFVIGEATHVPWASAVCDVTVSGLVLNFVADHESMTRELARITRPGGRVAVYVWDYAGGMHMLRHFWDAAVAVSPNDTHLDQGERFPVCQPAPLQALFERAGLKLVTVRAIDVPTVFQDFDDYWSPFLGGTGAAPTYLTSVTDEVRQRIRERLKSRLAPERDGPIELTARPGRSRESSEDAPPNVRPMGARMALAVLFAGCAGHAAGQAVATPPGDQLPERARNAFTRWYEKASEQPVTAAKLVPFESARGGTWKWTALPVMRGEGQSSPTRIIVDLSPDAIVHVTVRGTADDDGLARRVIEGLKTTTTPECYFPVLEQMLRAAHGDR